jgi:alpha-tubulin suppressor-like RCC1 family protein
MAPNWRARTLVLSLWSVVLLSLASCGGGSEPPTGPDVPDVQVASVTVTPEELDLTVGETRQLTATPRDQSGAALVGPSIAWASTEEAVASVSTTGLVTAIGEGSTTITASSGGKSGSATVAITFVPVAPVASVSVLPGELSLLAGDSRQLTATPKDELGNPLTGRSITWTTTDPSVAAVSSSGIVTAMGPGTASVAATSDGKSGNAVVSVSVLTFESFAAGGAHTCALTPSGGAYCWGRGESGQLGVPVPAATCPTDGGPMPCSRVPVAVNGGVAFAQLAGGGAHTCGLTSDGSAYCWGANGRGQLGDNSTANRDAPIAVATDLKFASIDAGAQHTCGLTSTGIGYCWGRNDRGQLGDGTTDTRLVPAAVTGSLGFQLIAAGGFSIGHTCALTDGGKAYCWGDNERGQLGNGSGGFGREDLDPHPAPAPVADAPTFVSLTAGLGRHTCGLTGAGSAYCWGENPFGALGDGSTGDRAAPVQVSGGLAFEQVVAGGFLGHTCGLTSAGPAYCWGDNSVGQVGDNSTLDRLEPSAVFDGARLSFTILDAGFRHTCGLASGGALYCWGSGGAGQLGTNSTDPATVPTKVVGQP